MKNSLSVKIIAAYRLLIEEQRKSYDDIICRGGDPYEYGMLDHDECLAFVIEQFVNGSRKKPKQLGSKFYWQVIEEKKRQSSKNKPKAKRERLVSTGKQVLGLPLSASK